MSFLQLNWKAAWLSTKILINYLSPTVLFQSLHYQQLLYENIDLRGDYYYDFLYFREEAIDYGELDTAMRKACNKFNIKDVDGKKSIFSSL